MQVKAMFTRFPMTKNLLGLIKTTRVTSNAPLFGVCHSQRRAAGRSNNPGEGLRPLSSPNGLITPSHVGGIRLVDTAMTTALAVHMAGRLLMRKETILSH